VWVRRTRPTKGQYTITDNEAEQRSTATIADFSVLRAVSTRWADVDVFGHINTSVYIQLFDTAINGWLVEEAAFDPRDASVIGVVAHYDCDYYREIHFPEALTIGLRVAAIGRTSVTYRATLFGADEFGAPTRVAAETQFVHVYIDRHTRRPVKIPPEVGFLLRAHVGPSSSAVQKNG
jgi:acyl-CoA thioester hydrolase